MNVHIELANTTARLLKKRSREMFHFIFGLTDSKTNGTFKTSRTT